TPRSLRRQAVTTVDAGHLTPRMAGPMREKFAVVALGALSARRPARHAHLAGLLGQQRAQVHVPRALGLPAGQLLVDVRTHLVAAAADAWAEMHLALVDRKPELREDPQRLRQDPAGDAAP